MFALILMTSLVVAVNISEGLPQVKLDNGIFTGIQMESYNGKDFNAFLGIPYAKSPIGELRFKVNTQGHVHAKIKLMFFGVDLEPGC